MNPVRGTFPSGLFRVAPVIHQLDPTFKTLEFSTYLGGVANGYASAVAVDSEGQAHVASAVGYGLYTTSGAITPGVPLPGPGYAGETCPFAALLDTSVATPALCLLPNENVAFGATAINGSAE